MRKRYSKRINFKSKRSYRKWLSYNYIHNPSKMGRKPHKTVYIRGKKHKVQHKRG